MFLGLKPKIFRQILDFKHQNGRREKHSAEKRQIVQIIFRLVGGNVPKKGLISAENFFSRLVFFFLNLKNSTV